jgi:hypothetical protein
MQTRLPCKLKGATRQWIWHGGQMRSIILHILLQAPGEGTIKSMMGSITSLSPIPFASGLTNTKKLLAYPEVAKKNG